MAPSYATDPVILVNSPLDGQVLGTNSVNYDLFITEINLDSIWYEVNGTNPTAIPAFGSITVPEGNHEITFYANDTAGNTGYDSINVTIDATDPVILVNSPLDGQILGTNYVNYDLSITEINLDSIWYEIDGTNPTVIPASGSITVPEGNHEITFYANDTAGNFDIFSINITIELEGVILEPGTAIYSQYNNSHNIEFSFTMLDWGILFFNDLDFFDGTIEVDGINGQLKTLFTYMFEVQVINQSAMADGNATIYYNSDNLPPGTKESQLLVLKWNEARDDWELVPNIQLNPTNKSIQFSIEPDAIYIIVGRTANNDLTLIIIIIVGGCIAGIVVSVGANKYRKKSKQTISSRKGTRAKKNINYSNAESVSAEYRKRGRLLKYEETYEEEKLKKLKSKKKALQMGEEKVDIQKRVENATQLESEVSLSKISPQCLIHKGDITGLSYTCKQCGSIYCLKCAKHIIEAGDDGCWNCHAAVPKELLDVKVKEGLELPIPKTNLTMFTRDVWIAIAQLEKEEKITPEIFDEVLGTLKLLPPDERMAYLEGDMFNDHMLEDDEDEY